MPDQAKRAKYGPGDPLVDFILGITYEIWEQRGLDRIHDYYGSQAPIYALSGVTVGAAAVVDGTKAMLASFPDRILVGDEVIWNGSRQSGYYSSHRIISTMTNLGASVFGPATGHQARVMTIADCEVRDGIIVREWLMRDGASLARQLDIDLIAAATTLRDSRSDETTRWIDQELSRLETTRVRESEHALAQRILEAQWISGDDAVIEEHFAPYAALHAAADDLHSGRDALCAQYQQLRDAFAVDALQVDHVAIPPDQPTDASIAVRWTACARHTGTYLGAAASDKRVFILGATHWRTMDGQITAQWTVFDQLGVLAQIL
jgi:predicted ester cyclase